MNIKRVISISVMLGACLMSQGCVQSFSPDVGHEIVLTQKPWFFGSGGVITEPVKPGLTWGVASTDAIDVYMQPQKYELDLPDTMTSDGVPITFHAIMVLQVIDSVQMISKFGPDWYKNNLEQQYGQFIRQAVRKRGMNETAISTVAIDEIDTEIKDDLIKFIEQKQLPLKLVTMTVGKANPPDAVKTQRVETARQEQRIQTEQKKKLAEDQRLQAEESRAAADNAYREAMHLSPEQFIQLESIGMQKEVCREGKCTFIANGVSAVWSVK